MKFKKVLTSSLLCAVFCLSFEMQKTSKVQAKEKLQIHTTSIEKLNNELLHSNTSKKELTVTYLNSTFDESEFSLVTEEDTKLPEGMSLNVFYTTKDIELKESTESDAKTITVIPKGSKVEMELLGNNFSNVKFDDKNGVVDSGALSKDEVSKDEKEKDKEEENSLKEKDKKENNTEVKEEPKEEPKEEAKEEQQKVTLYATDVLNVRENPSASSMRLGQLNKGDEVYGLDLGEWFEFDFNGNKAYVSKAFLSSEKPVVEETKEEPKEEPQQQESEQEQQETPSYPTNSSAVETVVNAALAQVGKPYVWASSNPSVGFDCSGLTSYAFRQAGININRIAADQYSNGTPVSKDNLVRGDLVFFSYGGGIGHVGLYIGNGQFVHAANYSTGVIVSNLNGYYSNVYAGAVRVIK